MKFDPEDNPLHVHSMSLKNPAIAGIPNVVDRTSQGHAPSLGIATRPPGLLLDPLQRTVNGRHRPRYIQPCLNACPN